MAEMNHSRNSAAISNSHSDVAGPSDQLILQRIRELSFQDPLTRRNAEAESYGHIDEYA